MGLMLVIYLILPESAAWWVSRDLEERVKKNMRRLYCDVDDFDVDQQYEILVQTILHERAVAIEMKRERWYAIFQDHNLRRTMASTWALSSQQVLGLTLFYTYAL